MLNLIAEETYPDNATHEQIIDLMRRTADAAKRPILTRLEQFRGLDPHLRIDSADTLFPVLIVETTQAVVNKLREEPGIMSINVDPTFHLINPPEPA